VCLVARDASAVRSIRDAGVEVEDPRSGERWCAHPEAACEAPAHAALALLCVRGPDTDEASAALARQSPNARVVVVQNGIHGDAQAARHFSRVLGAVIRHPCMRVAPNCVRALGAGRIAIGAYPSGGGADVDRAAAALRAGGYDVGVSRHIAEDRWLKLCFNLMSTPNALVRPAEHATRAFTEGKARLLEEARAALAAAGIAARSCDGRDRSLDAEIEFQRGALERGDAARALPLPVYNSLWVGLARGAPLEADAHHRAIIDLGERHGVATPTNRRALEGLARAVRTGMGPESFSAENLLGRA
jgi:2-dehydropantoate 2-reductase